MTDSAQHAPLKTGSASLKPPVKRSRDPAARAAQRAAKRAAALELAAQKAVALAVAREAAAIAWWDGLHLDMNVVDDVADCDAAIAAFPADALTGFDIETSGPGDAALDPRRGKIETAQFYTGGNVVDIFRGAALDRVLASVWFRNARLAVHNAAFELGYLLQRGCVPLRPVEDTLQMSRLLYPPPHKLADVCLRILGRAPPKDFGASDWAGPLTKGQLTYAGSDAVMCWALAQDMLAQLRGTKRWKAYVLARDTTLIAVKMTAKGVVIDRDEHARQMGATTATRAEADKTYCERAEIDKTYRTKDKAVLPKQGPQTVAIVEALLTKSQRAGWTLTDSGQLSTARVALKHLALDHPTLNALLTVRACDTLLNNEGESLRAKISADGRIHPEFLVAQANGGRFSCRNPNLQKMPRGEFRRIVVAAPGCVLICCDLNQIDVRVAAELTQDPALRGIFIDGTRDLHREAAARMMRCSLEQVTKTQRDAAKATTFGSLYGIGAHKLARDIFDKTGNLMSVAETRAWLDDFDAHYPTARAWQRRHADICMARGYVEVSTSGRLVKAAWVRGGLLSFNQCCALPVAGAVADVMMVALSLIDARLPDTAVGIIHDEFLIEVPKQDATAAAAVLAACMVEAFTTLFPQAPLHGLVESGVGRTWFDAKNPPKKAEKTDA